MNKNMLYGYDNNNNNNLYNYYINLKIIKLKQLNYIF